jgi:tetratricopeptide (TPR) repeat protein
MRRMLFVLAALAPALAGADDPPERTVQDLAYGEVLFAYFQDDHFTALTRLLAGLERNELPHHARDADLMLGALYLSYGQHRIAGEVFEQVLAQSVDPVLHDRAWFFLAKIWYQRGYLAEASAALARIQGALPEAFEPERVLLQAEVLMAEERFAEALAVLAAWDRPDPEWQGYIQYNIGVSLVRLGDVAGGARVLAEVGQIAANATTSEALLALRDKANVALGYAWLQAGRPVEAKPALQRVRLSGPYSNKALLGVGWADAEQQNFRAALAPWVELGDRDLLDSAVQESLLAVPYAFAQLNADGQAADHYQSAIAAFSAEIGRIDGAIASVQAGTLLGDWFAAQDTTGSGWYFELGQIPQSTESRYLVELLATNSFQEGVKNYRDLTAMSAGLDAWEESLAAFDDILATRQAAYLEKGPAIAASLEAIDLDALEQQRVRLESRLLTIEQTEDVVALGSGDQQRVWRELAAMAPDLARIEAEPDAAAIIEKHRFFEGLVLWDLRRDYRARLWSEQRNLRELDLALKEARRRQHDVSASVAGWSEDFARLSARIVALRPRVVALKAATDTALANQRDHLEAVAVEVLDAQRDRLGTYMVQARFSLASIYDRAAARAGAGSAATAVLAGDRP